MRLLHLANDVFDGKLQKQYSGDLNPSVKFFYICEIAPPSPKHK